MRRAFLLLLILPLAAPAWADACRDEIAALHDGPLEPLNRPPHKQITTVYDPDGSVVYDLVSLVKTPLRTISGQESANWFTMAIDRDVWNGPSLDGPWTANAAQMPEGREAQMRQLTLDFKANLSDTVCHGPDESGNPRYTFRTQSNPDATGAFFGSLDTVTLDATSGEAIRFERTEFVNSWTEGVSMQVWVSENIYDATITVSPPQ